MKGAWVWTVPWVCPDSLQRERSDITRRASPPHDLAVFIHHRVWGYLGVDRLTMLPGWLACRVGMQSLPVSFTYIPFPLTSNSTFPNSRQGDSPSSKDQLDSILTWGSRILQIIFQVFETILYTNSIRVVDSWSSICDKWRASSSSRHSSSRQSIPYVSVTSSIDKSTSRMHA